MAKRIADTVHGTVQLDDLEVRVIQSLTFQRLRGVKQLGLASLVFPGADYSRFSHSIGACHVVQSLIEALRGAGAEISTEDERIYRVAGLLHDVGHYPYSHAMERAVEEHYQQTANIEPAGGQAPDVGDPPGEALSHERLGAMLIASADLEVARILQADGIDPDRVISIIEHHQDAPPFANIVSSDLDADRIDYLLRTAQHTGLPYGHIDFDYLMTMIAIDGDNRICIDNRGMRTAEHLLLARYFDYQQVSHHKTVQGYERLLEDVLKSLVARDLLDCRTHHLESMAREPASWLGFDDAYVSHLIRELAQDDPASDDGVKAMALISRNGPKLAYSTEFFSKREDTAESLAYKKALLNTVSREVAADMGVPESRYWLWDNRGKPITSIGSTVHASHIRDVDEREAQALGIGVNILMEDGTCVPLAECRHSIVSVLSEHSLAVLRLYVLLVGDDGNQLREFRSRIKERMP